MTSRHAAKRRVATATTVAIALLIAGCAGAPARLPAGGPQAAGPLQANAVESDMICKRVRQMGSVIPQRVCGTEADWREVERAGRQGVDEFERQRQIESNTSVFGRRVETN